MNINIKSSLCSGNEEKNNKHDFSCRLFRQPMFQTTASVGCVTLTNVSQRDEIPLWPKKHFPHRASAELLAGQLEHVFSFLCFTLTRLSLVFVLTHQQVKLNKRFISCVTRTQRNTNIFHSPCSSLIRPTWSSGLLHRDITQTRRQDWVSHTEVSQDLQIQSSTNLWYGLLC